MVQWRPLPYLLVFQSEMHLQYVCILFCPSIYLEPWSSKFWCADASREDHPLMARVTLGPVRSATTRTVPSPGKVFRWTQIGAESALSGTGGCGLQHDATTVAEHCGHFDTDTEEGHTGCTGIYKEGVWSLWYRHWGGPHRMYQYIQGMGVAFRQKGCGLLH